MVELLQGLLGQVDWACRIFDDQGHTQPVNFHHSTSMSQKILSSLFAQKSWANRELFDVMASITSTEHTASLHKAVRMLNHIYVVDEIFRAHLLGEKHLYTATNTPQTPELSELHFAVAKPISGSKTL
jgi:hypothetical protein